MTSKEIAQKNEDDFQVAYTEWEQSKYSSTSAYQKMFSCMVFAAENLIKAKLGSASSFRDDIEDKAYDLTMLVFERDILGQRKRPGKLSSYLYLPMLGVLYNHQLVFEEQYANIDDAERHLDKEIDNEPSEKIYYADGKVVTEEQIKDPDFVMSVLFGWDYN